MTYAHGVIGGGNRCHLSTRLCAALAAASALLRSVGGSLAGDRHRDPSRLWARAAREPDLRADEASAGQTHSAIVPLAREAGLPSRGDRVLGSAVAPERGLRHADGTAREVGDRALASGIAPLPSIGLAHGVLLVTETLAGTPIAIAVVASNVVEVEKQVVHPSSVVIYEVDGDPVVVQVVN